MASRAACRLSRLAGRRLFPTRSFQTSSRYAVAQNFTMPALSPTMTEGSIASWQVKEGDRFSAGDVLLEIETDKASMDVEAQEDGQVFKILAADGSKGIAVGARIAVLAEADDDLASLSLPPDEPVALNKSASPTSSATPSAPVPASPTPPATLPATPSASAHAHAPAPLYARPLLPSVAQLIHQNGLSEDSVLQQATPTGPGGRLLKGDVLALLGQVPADLPATLAARFEALSHLDLSNIRIRAPQKKAESAQGADQKAAEAQKAQKAEAAKKEAAALPTTVSLPISLDAVLDAQDKIQASLGVFMPVSTFVQRATDVANDALPRAGPAPAPSAAQLFDEVVLGAKTAVKTAAAATTSGHYRPQMSSAPPSKAARRPLTVDLIDILAGTSKAAPAPRRVPKPQETYDGTNYFSIAVPAVEEKRARVFLERLKVVLENEPGRLVL